MEKYLFGPVHSRRLGRSLGIDLIPYKTCSLNCVYCECGRTTELITVRKEYVPTEAVLAEINRYLSQQPQLDYVTFAGSGEPTLHSRIGEVVRFIKTNFPAYRVALLTNSTLLHLAELRAELQAVDLLLPSLDAPSEEIFQQINRPAAGIHLQDMIEGLIAFRQNYSGLIWLEIFIMPGLNDSEAAIKEFRKLVHRIKPDLVQLNTLDRPGAEQWVQPATRDQLIAIAAQFDCPGEIIARFQAGIKITAAENEVENTLLRIIKRRPSTVADLAETLGLAPQEIHKHLEVLVKRRQAYASTVEQRVFFRGYQ